MTDRPLMWFKQNIIPIEEAQISVLSPTAQFGLNVFEGIRGYSNQAGQLFLFRLGDHLRRLMNSTRIIGIQAPYGNKDIANAIIEVLQANNMHDDLAVRVTLFVDGLGSWSSNEPVDMFIAPVYKKRNMLTGGFGKAGSTSSYRRVDDVNFPPRAKAGANYIGSRYAQLEANSVGGDVPIFLNCSGKVSESAGACVMMVRDSILVTPPKSASILESITRDTLLTLAKDLDIAIQERDIDRSELYLAEEVFLCGSSAEITPLTRIDGYDIGNGCIGPTTSQLSLHYFSCVDGTSSEHSEWLTAVW